MDIATQVSTYFATAADVTAAGEAVPHTSSGNTITPLIDGRRYFRAIRALLETMGQGPTVSDQFFYVTGWWLQFTDGSAVPVNTSLKPSPGDPPLSPTTRSLRPGSAFRLENDTAPPPGPLMAQLLADRANDGVDVRVMTWANPAVLLDSASRQGAPWEVVTHNLLSIEHLRGITVAGAQPLAERVIALSIPHIVGAAHIKMVLAHDGTKLWAFVGGIDFQEARVAGEMHNPSSEFWHDLTVAVDGPATQAIYDIYRNIWNEQMRALPKASFLLAGRTIKGVESGTTDVPVRSFPTTGSGKHHVQVAITLPQYNFGLVIGGWPYCTTPLSFAVSGRFAVKVAWRKAIKSATKYIYIEDQAFFSQEVMQWINSSLKANPDVKVILLASGISDPVDDPAGNSLSAPMVRAINDDLLDSLSPAQKARIGFFNRKNVFIHSKATIIDDHWLFVGSANHMRRSLYTDIEMSVATLDEGDDLTKKFRVDLWGGHFGKPPAQRAALNNLSGALSVWRAAWGVSPPFTLPSVSAFVVEIPLPIPVPMPIPSHLIFNAREYNLNDADSRDMFTIGDL